MQLCGRYVLRVSVLSQLVTRTVYVTHTAILRQQSRHRYMVKSAADIQVNNKESVSVVRTSNMYNILYTKQTITRTFQFTACKLTIG